MAELTHTVTRRGDSAMITVVWEALTNGSDTFEPFDLKDQGGISDAVLSIAGTIGTGVFGAESSVDDAVYSSVVEPGGASIALAAVGNSEIRGMAQFIKPELNSGTPTSIVCTLQFRKIGR